VYLGASVVAMSSHYEGLPMVLLEAQSLGLPIVAFACQCGPKDIISDGETGFLVPEGDVEGLAEKLITVIKDNVLRLSMGKQAKEASRRYEEEAVMQLWMDIFQTVMKA
jgi:glycosyltransferase involved in cell wall biosynthesis